MPSIQEMQADMQTAQQHGDTALAQHIGQLIQHAQRSGTAINGLPDYGDIGNRAAAAAMEAGHQLFGLGDLAGTASHWATQQLNGHPISWQQAQSDYQGALHSAEQTNPVSSGAGGIVGAVDAGVLGGEALKGAGLASDAAASLPRATTTAGRLANAGRVAARGAAAGAAQGGATAAGQSVARGDSLGRIVANTAQGAAVGGATGGVLSPVASAAGSRIANATASLDSKAAMALAKVFGEDPKDLQAAWSAFKADTGRAPTMAEMATFKQRGLIADAAKNSAPISDALRAADNAQGAARSQAMQATIDQLPGEAGPVAPMSSQEVQNATTARGDIDYGEARKFGFTIPTEESEALGGISPADHLASEVVPLAGLGKADRVRIMGDLQNGQLSGQDAQLIRSNLGRAQGTGANYSPAIASAQADLEQILGSPGNEEAKAALQQANQNYVAGAQRGAGAEHGEGILNNSESPENFAATAASKANANGNFAGGTASAAKTELTRAAGTVQGADALAQRFATDKNLYSKMVSTFGQSGADALQRMGAAESSASENLSTLSSRLPPSQDKDLKDTVNTFAHAAATIGSHGLFYKALHATRLVTGGGMSEAVQNKVAQYLADPKMTQQGINLLSKAGVRSEAVRRWVMRAAATVGGLTSSATEQ